MVTNGQRPQLVLLTGAQRAWRFLIVEHRMPAHARTRSGQGRRGMRRTPRNPACLGRRSRISTKVELMA